MKKLASAAMTLPVVPGDAIRNYSAGTAIWKPPAQVFAHAGVWEFREKRYEKNAYS